METREGLAVLDDNKKPKAMNGSIAVVPKREVSTEELEKAENELRARAKQLFKGIEENYWDLGQCLYDVYDGVPGGYRELLKGAGSRTVRQELFRKWGFKTFEEYAEKDIGILKRSAENMRLAYYWFEIKLHLPKELKEHVKALGRSKVYLLCNFVNEDNVMGWVEKAKVMTHDELKKTVKTAKAERGERNKDNEEKDQGTGTAGAGKVDHDAPKEPPAPETTHTLSTSLFEGQWETWQSAFERAKNISGSEKIGHNIELICQDFLMNNDFTKPEEDIKAHFAKQERLTHHKIIAINPKDGKPVYGTDLLWRLVTERQEHEKAEKSEPASDKTDEGGKVTPIRRKKKEVAESGLLPLPPSEDDGPKAG